MMVETRYPEDWPMRKYVNTRIPSLAVGGLPTLLLLAGLTSLGGLGGCGGRTFYSSWDSGVDTPDAALVPDSAVRPDASVRPDAGEDCADPATWEAVPTPLDSITVVNVGPAGGVPAGVAVRIAVELTYTGCDEMGGVQAQVFPNDQAVILTGYVWRYTGTRECPYSASTGREVFSLPDLVAGEWDIADYLVNGPFIPFEVLPCGPNRDCECDRWQGIPGEWGAACDFDCMCEDALDCNLEGQGNMGPQCFQTCSVSADCPQPLFCNEGFLPQTPSDVCMSTGLLDACTGDTDCPAGHACRPDPVLAENVCVAAMATQPIGRPCDSDCECPAGYSCVAEPDAFTPSCQIRCRGNRDCPEGTRCDPRRAPAGPRANALVCGFTSSPSL